MSEYIVREIGYPGAVKQEVVAELVRCKDCEFKDGACCDYPAVYVHDNGYCSWGRKRE